jgi:hypothetical protein
MSNELLKTPQEFIDEESDNLKNYLKENSDVQINKLGIIGFFINLLGNIRYDSTQYYQKLFMESNVSTAVDENNLYIHSSIFGYTPLLATPSTAEGSFTFDFANLPNSNVSKRTVIVKNINFEIDGIYFKTNVDYKFVEEDDTYYCIVYFEDGSIKYVPASSSSIEVPFYNMYQNIEETEIIEIPSYDLYSFYNYKLDISPYYLSNLQIYIKEESSLDNELYSLKLVKYLSNSSSKDYFLNILSTNIFNIEFGSGINGKHIPNSTATIVKTLTLGEQGHLNNDITINVSPTTTISLNSFNDIANEFESSGNISNKLLLVNFLYSHSGNNPNSGEELRKDVLKFIQTRNFLINKTDYENLTTIDDNEFIYVFKKSMIQRNDFYLYQVLRDSLQLPIKSLCYNVSKLDIDSSITGLTLSETIETDGNLTGEYTYTVLASNNFHISIAVNDTITVSGGNNAVSISWDEFSLAQYYIIVIYDGSDYRFLKTTNTTLIDIGQDSNCINNFYINSIETDDNFSWENSYIFYPVFTISDIEFISPFIYKYNSFMNWFDGYIFNNNFILLFSRYEKSIDDTYTIPNFQLQIKYDYYNKYTKLSIISTQDCSDYSIKISISNTTVQNELITISEDNNYYYYYENEDTNGLLLDSHYIEINIYLTDALDETLVTFKTDNFSQLLSVTDQLKLINYLDENDNNNIIDIPLIEKDIYDNNQEYYNNRLYNIINQSQISINRFPTDEIQYRFSNTYYISNIYLRNITVQEYNFDLILPLNLNISITYDNNYLSNNSLNLTVEKDNLYLEIANKLQNEYTGNIIKFYNSHIVDFVHNKPFVKTLTVEVVDSNDTTISSGIEIYDNDTILKNLQEDTYDTDEYNAKLNIINYNPHYFWWDVDNINITYNY